MPRIYLIAVTNQDGVQTARLSLAKLQKTMVNLYLSQLGVYQSEFGFPFLRNEHNYLIANLELKETARQVLELVQYANAHTQRPLTDDELRFIAYYPRQVKRILTITPLDGHEPHPVSEKPTPILAGV